MADEHTYGFSLEDAQALLPLIGTGDVIFQEGRPRGGNGGRIIGLLDGDLAPATAFATAPGSATLSVWIKNSSGDLEDSGRNETVVNRFLYGTTISAGTVVKAESIEGEWQVYAADCEG